MKIFIPRIPNTVTPDDLRVFSANILEKKVHLPFTNHPSILSCDIILIKDVQLGLVEHHGLISVRPDAAGQWFIRNMKTHRLHNKLLYARQYYARKDRGLALLPENDRRRKHLEIGKLQVRDIYIEGLDQFARTY